MPLYVRTLLATAAPAEIEEARAGHLAQLRELKALGRLRAAGELDEGGGFLDIFEAADLLDAERIARASPLVGDGLGAWMLRVWHELEL